MSITSKNDAATNQRVHPRVSPPNLYVSERTQTHLFISAVENISLGGVLLKGRIISPEDDGSPSLITLQTKSGPLGIQAMPIYDKPLGPSYGVGYSFIHTQKSQAQLKDLLRDLNQNSAS